MVDRRSLVAFGALALIAVAGISTAMLTTSADARSVPAPKTVTLAKASWLGSWDSAKREAARDGRPILHLQMFGELDDAFC